MEKEQKPTETQLSPLALAFLGDSVHTTYVRTEVLKGQQNKLNNYHNLAKKFCNAKSQKETLERLQSSLSVQESDVVRRARNSHAKHSAKNYDEETYKKATAFEALVGWLYVTENHDRLQEVLKESMKEQNNAN